MKQVVLRIDDAAYENFMGMVSLCPMVEVVAEGDLADTENDRDLCMRQAIITLRQNKVFRHYYDYTWIMMAINEGVLDDFDSFKSPQAFIDYLALLGVESLPGKTTLFRTYNITDGTYPNWTFLDNPKHEEVLRRKNILVRFLSAYMRAKRTMWNNQ